MNRQDIDTAIAKIMLALARDEMQRPTFTTNEARDKWMKDTADIENAGKVATAQLIGDALANLSSIADSLRKMAQPQGRPTLFGEIIAETSGNAGA